MLTSIRQQLQRHPLILCINGGEICNYYGQESIALWPYPKNGIYLFGGNFIPHSIAKSKADAQWNPLAWTWFADRWATLKPNCVHGAAAAAQLQCHLWKTKNAHAYSHLKSILTVLATIPLDELCYTFTGSSTGANGLTVWSVHLENYRLAN